MSSLQVYNFPVILPDLRREESLRQIADVLDYLDNVANDVFSKISERVADNRDRLVDINNRVNGAQARVDKIKSSRNKATKVFSSSKFPAPKDVNAYHSLYKQDDANPLSAPKYTPLKEEARFALVDGHLLQEKLHFFDVRVKVTKRRTKRAADEDEAGEGLGGLPTNINSVSSMLLFNTTENPYKKYSMIDPLLGAQSKTRRSVEEDEARALTEAPMSISEREQLGRAQPDRYFYAPAMGDVPEIEAPTSLPDLPGVADDILYEAELLSIAPSVPSVIPDLPSVGEGEAAAPSEGGPPPPPSAGSAPPPPPPEGGAPPPPPPPPPPANAPPPPGPPPPPSAQAPGAPDSDDDESGPPLGGGGGGGGRSSLLDSIRNAKNLKLKSAKERKLKKKAVKEEKSSGGGPDLMGDLMSKLTLRRKGISGSKKAAAEAETPEDGPPAPPAGGALGKISKMIPAPKAKATSTDGGDSGDDWVD